MLLPRLLATALCALATLGLAAAPANAQAPVATYQFSPVNQHSLQLSASYWNPILEHVSQRSGVRLQLKLGRTSAETTALVLAGEADFAFTNHLFSPERAKLGWKVFGRRNAPAVSGQIIVPAESSIRTLADLADKDVAFPGPEALVAYKVTFAQLIERKVPARPVFAGNLDAAFSQLVSGRAAAMGTNSQMVAEYSARENRSFRVLWNSQPFSDLALMASPRVPEAHLQAVARAFLGMHRDPEGRQVLENAARVIQAKDPISFIAATDADYASYRDFYRTAPPALR